MTRSPSPWLDDEDEKDDEKAKAAPPSLVKLLLDSRTVLLCGPVDDKMAREALAQLLVLDAQDAEKPIRIYINSPGGSVDAGYAIYDVMKFVRAPVHTICAGLAASAATVILLGADKGKRFTMPNTRFLLHQPSMGLQGQATDVHIGALEVIKLRKQIYALLAEATGQTFDRIKEDADRDFWMTADEAKNYGLVDAIVGSAADLPEPA